MLEEVEQLNKKDSIEENLLKTFSPDQEVFSYRKVINLVLYLSITFFILFSAYLSYLNMISQIYADFNYQNLGNIALFTLYGSFGIGSLIATNFAQKFEYTKVMTLCAFVITLQVALGIYISSCEKSSHEGICSQFSIYFIVTIVSFLSGFFDTTLWICQSGYMDRLCSMYNQKSGTLFGIFWSINQVSQVSGMVIAWQMIDLKGYMFYFFILTCFGTVSVVMFSFMPSIKIKASVVIQKISLKKTLLSVYKTSIQKDVFPQYSYFCQGGVVIAYYSGIFHLVIENSLKGYSNEQISVRTTFVFICLGIFEIFTGISSGMLAEKLHKMMIISNLIFLLAMALTLINIQVESYLLCFFCSALFGISDCSYLNYSCLACNQDMDGRLEAFSLFKFFQGMTVALILILNVILSGQSIYIITSICIFLSLANLIFTFKLKKPNQFNLRFQETDQIILQKEQDNKNPNIIHTTTL